MRGESIRHANEVRVIDPCNYAESERLTDGTVVFIRSIRADDGEKIHDAFIRQDKESIYTRFFAYKKDLTDTELRHITDVDFQRVVALVVTVGSAESDAVIGGGRYVRGDAAVEARRAELAFMTDDKFRGRGIASVLLRHLIRIGRETGVAEFIADVLAENRPMLAVFRRSGLPMKEIHEGAVLHLTLSLTTARPDPPFPSS